MTVEELGKKKRELEDRIESLLEDFTEETDLNIGGITMHTYTSNKRYYPIRVQVYL